MPTTIRWACPTELTADEARVAQALHRPDPTTGRRRILRGVAKGRQPSLGDPEMRPGRKSRHRPFTGYKRHVVTLLEPDLIRRRQAGRRKTRRSIACRL
jgi:hypothetical protein